MLRKTRLFPHIVFYLVGFFLFALMGNAEELKVKVTALEGKVRQEPNLNSRIIALVQKGEILKADLGKGDWIRVFLNSDEKGEILSGYLQILEVSTVAGEFEEPLTQPVEIQTVEEEDQTGRTSNMEFGIRISGGADYFFGQNDINDHIIGEYNDWVDHYRGLVCGKSRPVQIGIESSAEFFVNFSPSVGIGLGIGYIHANRSSSVRLPNYLQTFNPKVTAIPLTLSFYLGIPTGNNLKFFAHAGIGYYLGKIYWRAGELDYYDYESDIQIFWKATSNIIGYHGGLGFEWKLSEKMAIMFIGTGRFGKFKDLMGTFIFEAKTPDGIAEDSVENLSFWSFDREGYVNVYKSFGFFEEEPVELINYRKGEIELNNFGFQIGIKIRLNKAPK